MIVAVCFGAFLLPFLLFPTLYEVHAYYSIACGVFLILGISKLMGYLSKYLQIAVLVLIVASQIADFHNRYDLRPSDGGLVAFAHAIRDRTKPDDVILIYGWEWDPSLAYYAERKAVMFPASLMTPEEISRESQWANSLNVGAVIRCAPQKGCEVQYR